MEQMNTHSFASCYVIETVYCCSDNAGMFIIQHSRALMIDTHLSSEVDKFINPTCLIY
uniref:Uncharacterized protein n=1 Tax=Rhizophora mucronata TaxID=61149 RepID=A0A2P2Q8D5_RHIMU